MAGDPWAEFKTNLAPDEPATMQRGGRSIPVLTVRPGADPWAEFKTNLEPAAAAAGGAAAVPGAVGARGAAAAPAGSPAPAEPKRGWIPNVGAALVEGAAGLGNVLSDPFGNLVGRPVTTAAIAAHDFLAPHFGYQPFPDDVRRLLLEDNTPQPGTRATEAVGRAVGAPLPSEVEATPGQALMRSAVAGGMATAPLVPSALAGAAIGAAGGWLGEAAAQASPERYKEFWSLVGNLAGGGLAAVGEAGVRAGARGVQNIRQPMNVGKEVTPTNPATGAPFEDTMTGEPIKLREGQLRLVGQQIVDASGKSRDEVLGSIPPTADLAGSVGPVTLGQATGNLGILGHERRLQQLPSVVPGGPDNSGGFTDLRARQHVAWRNALEGQMGPEETRSAAAAFISDRLKTIRSAQEALDTAGQAGLRTQTEGLGGSPAGMTEQDLGRAQQQGLELLRKPVDAAMSRMAKAIDPDGTLAVNSQRVSDVASILNGEENAGIIRRMGEDEVKRLRGFAINRDTGAAIGPEGAMIAAAVKNYAGVKLFSQLRSLDSALAEAQRNMLGGNGPGRKSRPYTQLSMLREAVDHAISEGASGEAAASPEAAARIASLIPEGEGVAAPSAGGVVVTPSGERVGVRYVIRNAEDLVTSHDDALRPNPAFPAELQPRERDRTASAAQINRIATQMQPELLGPSATINEGAPIIGPDGVVESGNGRVIGIRRAYAADNDSAKAYRAWLTSQGYDVSGMRAPVLARERTTEMDAARRQRWVEEGTAATGLALSAGERAAVDAGRLTPDLLAQIKPGDIDSEANRGFVRAFIHGVADEPERAGFWTANNELSVDGARRIRNALLQRAYGDRDLVAALAETGDENIKALGGALQDAAGGFARLQAGIESGAVDPGVSLTPSILEAVRLVKLARSQRISLRDAVGQMEMGASRPPETEALLRAAYGDTLAGRASQARMTDFLNFYAAEAEQQSAAPRLFGENLTPQQILQEASARARRANQGGGGGQGADTGGDQARGPGAGAPRQAAPEASPGETADLSRPPLVPNLTEGDAAARKAFNRAYAEYKGTWARGAVGEVLESGLTDTGFHLPESATPAKLFAKGPGGAEAADSLIKATGSPEAAAKLLGDYPAFAFRRAAEVDGVIDPRKAEAFLKAHAAVFSKFPGMADRFRDVASATEAVQQAAIAGRQRIEAYENSAAGHYLPKDGGAEIEPQVAIGRLLSSPTATADAKALMQEVRAVPAAEEGVKRNFIEYLLTKASVTAEAATTGVPEIGGGTFLKFMRNPRNAAVAEAILGPDGADLLLKVGKEIERGARIVNATKIPGSPATASDLNKIAHQALHGESFLLQMTIGALVERLSAVGLSEGGVTGLPTLASGALGIGATLGMRHLNAARMAGFARVQDLATQAVLQPEFGRAAVQAMRPETREARTAFILKRLAAIGAGGQQRKEDR